MTELRCGAVCPPLSICSSARTSAYVPMLWAMTCTHLRVRSLDDVLEEPSEVGDGELVGRLVVSVVANAALGWPAVQNRRAVEAEVVRNLGSAIDRIVERDVEAVYEHEGLVSSRAIDVGGQETVERLVSVHVTVHDDEVLVGVFGELQPEP